MAGSGGRPTNERMDELRILSCRAVLAVSVDTTQVLAQLCASREAVASARRLLGEPVFPYPGAPPGSRP